MNLTDQLIIEDYRKHRDEFVQLGDIVHGILKSVMQHSDIKYLSIEHRIKTEKSLAGKLIRYDGWFRSFGELMDILGARVVCYFSDDVDVIGKAIENEFVIDRENSSDKRKLIQSDSFGYLSLHYICSLPKDKGYPEKLTNWKFEIQIRTILQHAWSDIEHDIGYKSEFGVPREFARGFARIAGLLELADDEFVRLRNGMADYSSQVRQSIIDGSAGDIRLNVVSLNEYVRTNVAMQEFIGDISRITGAEIDYTDAAGYLEQLAWLKVTTIGDLSDMFMRNKTNALALAKKALSASDLDILSSNTALRFLCHSELLSKAYDRGQIIEFFNISSRGVNRAEKQADSLLAKRELLSEV